MGIRYLGFQFESRGTVTIPAPTPNPATTPAVPVLPLRVAPRPEVASTFELEGIEFSLPEGATVRVAEDGLILVAFGDQEIGIRRIIKKPKARRLKVKQVATTKQTA